MSDKAPERFTVSIRPDDPLDLDQLDELVRESEYGSRSEYIRAAILDRDSDVIDDDGDCS